MTTTNLLYLIMPLIPIIVFNHHFKLPINKQITYSLFRMVVQLSLIGLVLQYFFDLNNGWVNVLYVTFMMTIATRAMLKAADMPTKIFGPYLWVAVFIPHICILLFFTVLVLDLDNVLDARYFIPIGGMLLGNSLSGNILAISNFYSRLKDQEKKYYYRLALSANRSEALAPYFRFALKSSINPTLASMETIGLVALPGMMTGQILGGSIPITAIKYQIAIMVAIFVARYLTAVLAIWLTSKKAFDAYDRLIPELN